MALPYMYTDKPQKVEMIADVGAVDQIVDRFGNEVVLENLDEKKIKVKLNANFDRSMPYKLTAPVKRRVLLCVYFQYSKSKYKLLLAFSSCSRSSRIVF